MYPNNKIGLYAIPHWCATAIDKAGLDLSILDDKKNLNDYSDVISALDLTDIQITNYRLTELLDIDATYRVPTIDEPYIIEKPWVVPASKHSEYIYGPNHLKRILDSVSNTYTKDSYEIKIINTNMVVIIMNDGFGHIFSQSNEKRKEFYRDVLNSLLKMAPLYSVMRTGIFKKYLTI